MNRCSRVTVLAGGLVFAIAGGLRAETLEEVEKKISDLIGKYKTIQYKHKYSMNLDMEQMKMKSSGDGTVAYKRKGDKGYMSRIETKGKEVRKIQDQAEENVESSNLMVFDGKHLYNYMVSGETKHAMKSTPPEGGMNPFDHTALFKEQHKHFDFKLLPDEKVDGKPVWVIEGKLKEQAVPTQAANAFRSVSYYDQKTGIGIKSVSYDKDGKEVSSSVISDLKLDGEISDDQFVFKAPEGVEVMDMDKLQQGQQQADHSANKEEKAAEPESEKKEEAKGEQKKDDEPKKEEPKKKKGGIGDVLKKLK